MPNWYVSLESIKNSAGIRGVDLHSQVGSVIEDKSEEVREHTRRIFIPRTQTRVYRWTQREGVRSWVLDLDEDLLSVTTLQTKAQDSSPTTIASSDFFLEPANEDRFHSIEIDLSSDAAFEAGVSSQRTISVAGSWGYSNTTKGAGTVDDSGGISASDTTLVVSNASLIDVGDTLLIESEQIFVSDRDFAALGSVLINDASVTADLADNVITLDPSHGVLKGEVMRLDSEKMLVESISTNDATVIRAYDGSVLATHANDTAVHINRTLTIERGVNGTTAATHADTTAISKYVVPARIRELVKAEVIFHLQQDRSAWARVIGTEGNEQQVTAAGINRLRDSVEEFITRHRSAAI